MTVEKIMYEQAREKTIAANNEVLKTLGLNPDIVPSVPVEDQSSGNSDYKPPDNEQEQACANVLGVRVCNAHHSLHCYLHHTSGPRKKEAPP